MGFALPTLPSDIRISVRIGKKNTRKIELIHLPYSSDKYWIRIDGKKSEKVEVTTITEVTSMIRKWLCSKS